MKVLVIIRRSPAQRLLVKLHKNRVESEFRKLLAKHRHAQAIMLAFTQGIVQKEIREQDVPDIKVELILTENNVYWDVGTRH